MKSEETRRLQEVAGATAKLAELTKRAESERRGFRMWAEKRLATRGSITLTPAEAKHRAEALGAVRRTETAIADALDALCNAIEAVYRLRRREMPNAVVLSLEVYDEAAQSIRANAGRFPKIEQRLAATAPKRITRADIGRDIIEIAARRRHSGRKSSHD